jgi:predicted ATPase/class 3 adenylate cyclase
MTDFPIGTVTFLFTDIEGSTQLVHRFGDRYPELLAEHHQLLRGVFEAHSGYEVNTDGDAFFIAFDRASDGVAAAVSAQQALAAHQWPDEAVIRVRMGLHTGDAVRTGDDYAGIDVHRAARISASAHGGQVLISEAVKVLAAHRLPANVTVRDLGQHRLKDLPEPEHLFQLVISDVPSEFPPVRSVSNRPNNLPIHIPPLIGRERELPQLCELARPTEVRLITLTGAGGTGKTLLALHAARELLTDLSDGAFFIPLAGITDAPLVLFEIAQALGIAEAGSQMLLTRLTDHLRDRRLLLVLDNFEQVLGASKAVSTLIENCPHLTIIVTSRTPLRVRGEHPFEVPPLDVTALAGASSVEKAVASPAVQLFVSRAKEIKRDFDLTEQNAAAVAEICARLDGLPLAIELAAARVELLSPQAMLTRLVNSGGRLSLQILSGGAHDLPARQRAIRNAIAWSYDLLDDGLKEVFARLSVFAGGCSLETAEAVCRRKDSQEEVLDDIASLIAKNLVRQEQSAEGESRLGMLNIVREFGLEQLQALGLSDDAHRAHAEHFAALAENTQTDSIGPAEVARRHRLEAEQDNFRAALRWCFDRAPDLGLRLASGLGNLWLAQGHWAELNAVYEEALKHSIGGSPELRARCARYAGKCAQIQGDAARAHELFEESLALAEEAKSDGEIMRTLHQLGYTLAHKAGRRSEARPLLDRALQLARGARDEKQIANSFYYLAEFAISVSDFALARSMDDDALAIYRRRNDKGGVALCMIHLADVGLVTGDVQRVRSYLDIAQGIHEQAADQHGLTWDRYRLAQLDIHRGNYEHARSLLRDCAKSFERMKARPGEAWSLYQLGRVALCEEEFLDASSYLENSLRLFRTVAGGTEWALLELGGVAIYEGRLKSARKFLQKALTEMREAESTLGIAQALSTLARLARLQGEYESASACLHESFDLVKSTSANRSAAIVIQQLAYLADVQAQHDRAALLLGTLEALREEMGSPIAPCDRGKYERTLAAARTALGDELFAQKFAEGRQSPWQKLVL